MKSMKNLPLTLKASVYVALTLFCLSALPALCVLLAGAVGVELLPRGNNGLGLFLAPVMAVYIGAFIVAVGGTLTLILKGCAIVRGHRPVHVPAQPESEEREI